MKGLLSSIKTSFSRELIGHIAARLGEGENSVSKALGGIVPVVLSCLAHWKAALGRRHHSLEAPRNGIGVVSRFVCGKM